MSDRVLCNQISTGFKKRRLSHRAPDHEKGPELPSTEKPSGSNVGIGSMPGSNRESGVATLPEERVNGKPFGQSHTGFESKCAPSTLIFTMGR